MTDLVVETPEGLSLRHELAGAGARSAAGLIDLALWGLAMFWAVLLLSLLEAGSLLMWLATGGILTLYAYHILFAVFWDGLTPGKWLVGLRTIDEGGFPASPRQHLLRGFFWPLEAVLLSVPVPFGIVLMACTPRRQRLGDMVAGTVVVHQEDRSAVREPYARESWSTLERRELALVPAHAARFEGADLDYLRELLSRSGIAPESAGRLFRASARHYAERLDLEVAPDLGAAAARRFLRELYLFLREMRRRGRVV